MKLLSKSVSSAVSIACLSWITVHSGHIYAAGSSAGNMCSGCNIVPVSCQLLWKNEAPEQFIHWGVEHKMVPGDDHIVFTSADLPDTLTNPPAGGTTVNVDFGTWEERTPFVNDSYQPGEQINVIFLDASDTVIWRSSFSDDVLDTAPTDKVFSVVDENVVITTAVATILVAHKSHATYNTDLGWTGSVYPNHVCLNIQAIDPPEPPPPSLPPVDFGSKGRFNVRDIN